MKHVFVLMVFASLFSNMAFAAEVSTECPWMQEQNDRSNPKAKKLQIVKEETPKTNSSTVAR